MTTSHSRHSTAPIPPPSFIPPARPDVPREHDKEIAGVRIDQATAKMIAAAKIPLQHGITGDKPAGEVIARTHVEQIMSKLG